MPDKSSSLSTTGSFWSSSSSFFSSLFSLFLLIKDPIFFQWDGTLFRRRISIFVAEIETLLSAQLISWNKINYFKYFEAVMMSLFWKLINITLSLNIQVRKNLFLFFRRHLIHKKVTYSSHEHLYQQNLLIFYQWKEFFSFESDKSELSFY